MKIGLYLKKPIPVRAMQWNGTQEEADAIKRFLGDVVAYALGGENANSRSQACISIKTSFGLANVWPNDWIIEDATGEWYPCSLAVFEKTYDEVPE